jgi:diaminohydroxyphosphoribosylaminopyrimidine deaminase/5-amino-6-(5-phosphoribosylamino)uracil reductase
LPEAQAHGSELQSSNFKLQGFKLFRVSRDETLMQLACKEARKGVGRTSPNPAVGAVLVLRGKVIARAWHRAAGLAHAEIDALRKVSSARGGTLYVTLEPCSTQGRTPPCVDALIAARPRRVVIGTLDPNPKHAGRAVEILKAAGIEVCTGILEKECRELNPGFNKWITTGMPYVIAKAGMSLDGRITRPPGEGQWLTGRSARADVQRLRAGVDAILIGGATLRVDDPQLTVRGVRGAVQPWRVVVSRSGDLPQAARLFTDEYRDRTLVYTGKGLRAVLRDLGRRGVTSVLIEGGMRILGEAFDGRLVDRVHLYVAPLLCAGPKLAIGGRGAGSTAEAPRIINPDYRLLGRDLALSGDIAYPAIGFR